MEIIVRKNDLVKELSARPGDRRAQELHPDPLQRPGRGARSGELRIAATDLDVSLRCGCAAAGRRGGRHHPRGQEALRDRALPARERRAPQGPARLPGPPIECERVSFKMAGPAQGGLSGPARRQGRPRASRFPRRRPARPHRAHRLRHHRRGRPLLPGRRAPRPRQGRRRPWSRPTGTASPTRGARWRSRSTEAVRVLVPRKAIHELARLLESEDARHLPAGGKPPRVLGRRAHPRLEDRSKGSSRPSRRSSPLTGDKIVTLDREALATAIRRVSLLSSERSRAVRSCTLRAGQLDLAGLLARPGRGARVAGRRLRGRGRRDRLQRPIPPRLPGGGGHRVRPARAEGRGEPGRVPARRARATTDYRYVVMPMRL